MVVKVNGLDRDLPQDTTVLALLETLRLSPDKVAVEVNRRLVRTEQYRAPLNTGDQVEIVTFVGGG
jgi:thiamine biosynthesis protein ThiS